MYRSSFCLLLLTSQKERLNYQFHISQHTTECTFMVSSPTDIKISRFLVVFNSLRLVNMLFKILCPGSKFCYVPINQQEMVIKVTQGASDNILRVLLSLLTETYCFSYLKISENYNCFIFVGSCPSHSITEKELIHVQLLKTQ